MSDRQVFRQLASQFVLGAALGVLFTAGLLALNAHHLLDLVLQSAAPATTFAILFFSVSTYFAFGVAITGFQFAMIDRGNADRI
jgi:hypothetical protein